MDYKIDNIKNYSSTKDWICGQFFDEGNIVKNDNLEVKLSTMLPGFTEPVHFHPHGTEVVIILEGKVTFQLNGVSKVLTDGDFIFITNKVKEAVIEVHNPTKYIVVRTPSVPDNKTYT